MKAVRFLTCVLLLLGNTVYGQSYEDILWTADWHQNGQYIAMGGNHGLLYIFSGEDYSLLDTLAVDGTITNVHFHPTENKLAVVTQVSIMGSGIFDLDTKEFTPFPFISVTGGRGLHWDKTGERLAIGDNEGILLIYSDDLVLIDSLTADPKSITGLDWSPDGSRITTVGSIHSIYNVAEKNLYQYEPRRESVLHLCIAWHPDGEQYVSGDYGDYDNDYKPLLQWRNAAGDLLKSVEASKAEYRNIRWSPSGSLLATASDQLRIWSDGGILLKELQGTDLLWGLVWHPEGGSVLTTSITGEALIRNMKGEVIHDFQLR